MLHTNAVHYGTKRAWRCVGHGRFGRRYAKKLANRRFRHNFNQQVSTGHVEAFSEVRLGLACFLKTWDIW